MKSITPKRLFLSLLACAVTSPVFADVATDINSANSLVREGKFDEALGTYQSITPSDSIKDDLDYNLAVAQYRIGDIESAKAMFTEAATSSDRKLAAAARYNLGNCFYTDAIAAVEKDKPHAIESLGEAIAHYRGSLAGNPNHVDARTNIELAVALLKKLQQEQEQQQPQQNEQQQSEAQENQDQGSQSKDSQSQEQKGETDQSKSEQQQSGSEEKQSKQDQTQDQSGQPQESKEQSENDGQSKAGQSAKENASQTSSQDQQAQEQHAGEQQQTAESGEDQQTEANEDPVPSGELKAASKQDVSEKSNGKVSIADPNAKDGLMSKEEALKMLQAVRDRDMLRRLRQEQVERNRHVPTDKDW